MALVTGAVPRAGRGRAAPKPSKVLGVDILRDRTMRDYAVAAAAAARPTGAGDGTRWRPAARRSRRSSSSQLLTSPQSVVITEKLARRRGYALGDEIRLMAGDRVNTYVVRALLEDTGPARVMDGSFVLMDIAAAQLAFDRLGRIDRIDVRIARADGARRVADADQRRHRRRGRGHPARACRPGSPPAGRPAAASRSSGCSPRST